MTRTPLPGRRGSVTIKVMHTGAGGVVNEYTVTYGFNAANAVCEFFCNSPKDGSDLQAMISDSCIWASNLLQLDVSIAHLADMCLENRPEGAQAGPAASPLGAIARAGAALGADVATWPSVYEEAAQ